VTPGSTGQFDVVVDGETVFSKYETRRFPEHAEVLAKLKPRVAGEPA
jgi:selT/selW/selH-like putative selenoprotein